MIVCACHSYSDPQSTFCDTCTPHSITLFSTLVYPISVATDDSVRHAWSEENEDWIQVCISICMNVQAPYRKNRLFSSSVFRKSFHNHDEHYRTYWLDFSKFSEEVSGVRFNFPVTGEVLRISWCVESASSRDTARPTYVSSHCSPSPASQLYPAHLEVLFRKAFTDFETYLLYSPAKFLRVFLNIASHCDKNLSCHFSWHFIVIYSVSC